MPSSNSPRDDGAPDGANNIENPFVKFRNVVDYHIGSVLQGIIGLPTILSRDPNSGNGRWPELEDSSHRTQGDSRRQSTQSGAWENTSDEEVKIPVKKFRGESPGGNDAFGPSHQDKDDDDYDLFSAFDDSVMERVKRSAQGHPWLDLQPGDELRWRYDPTSGPGLQKRIQQRFHASLINLRSYNGGTEPAVLPDKSVVPYLLFSSYSPLNLTAMPPLRRNDDPFGRDYDQFSYCDAFADLLRASVDKPMSNRSVDLFKRQLHFSHTKLSPADIGMMWMGTTLVTENILQEDPMPEEVLISHPSWGKIGRKELSPIAMVIHNFLFHLQEYGDDEELSQSDAKTEQDMYERFFTPGLSPPGRGEYISKTVHELLAMLESEGRAIRDVFNDADPTERSETSEQTSSSTTHINSSRASGLESLIGSTSTGASSGERVVSSSTSTTQHTDEDGTVRTKIVIEKRYADGRKSVTETSHVQSPSGEKQVHSNDYVEPAGGKSGKDNEKGEAGKNKGWFWN
ncbi:hypothetical protein O988_01641 [Pseudogymnoascus sp. VKM F-3808]|nr:hypothetical protein O988_01641 [Pseudogymnoascus sp. VKM F-3808]